MRKLLLVAFLGQILVHFAIAQTSDSKAFATKTDSGSTTNGVTPGNAPSGQLLVTLALDAPSVERVVFAAERGSIWLSLEPDNAGSTGDKVVTRSNVQ